MKTVVPGVFIMEGSRGAHVYLLQSDTGAVLVDTGIAADANKILAQVSLAGIASSIHSIVITHFHGDHVGGAAKLAKQWGVEVMAHKQDATYITKPSSIPALSSPKQLVNWVGLNLVLRSAPCRVDRFLEDGDKIDALSGCIVIHTPGHTLGSICLYQPERQILFCGDAIFNENPATRKPGMGLYLRPLTLDNAQAAQSVRRLATLPVQVICFGHGEPIVGDAQEQMRLLIAGLPAVQ